MNALDLIGLAGAACLRARLRDISPDDGVARFMLNYLTGPQVAAIVREVLKLPNAGDIHIAIPRPLVASEALPESVMTDEKTVALRNAPCPKPALLLANVDDDQGASLELVAAIGAKQLTEDANYWVQAASLGLGLSEDQLEIWKVALGGLASADDWSLQQTAQYVELTRSAIYNEGLPLMSALGWSLPGINLPRDSGYFTLKPKEQRSQARWRKAFERLISERKPLLNKQRPSRQRIEAEELRSQYTLVKDEIFPAAHSAIEAFIEAAPGWHSSAAALSEFEWESHGILQLFSGLRTRPTNFVQETINYFEDAKPDRLNENDKSYLAQMLERPSLKESREDDREFYEAHRDDLADERQLRAKWEKFVYGRPIECEDFIDGLIQAIERLFGQAPSLSGKRSIEIRTSRRTNNQWLELNADVGLMFELRYRGLPKILGANVQWDVARLFEYDALLNKKKTGKKYRRNTSVSRASTQIRFDVSLKVGDEKTTAQLIWKAQPNAVGMELLDDLERLLKRPFVGSHVDRLPVSKKGALQSVSLADTGTLQAAFGQDAGSLLPRQTAGEDLGKVFAASLKDAIIAGRINIEDAGIITNAWTTFSDKYKLALQTWRDQGTGTIFLEQAEAYSDLLRELTSRATGDLNRRHLWQPVLALGCVAIQGGAPSAIVAPWHPLRLAATTTKLNSFAGFLKYLLTTSEVNFGDRRLFFADLRAEFSHVFYPEIAVGYHGTEPVLLTETATLNEYSLMERPVRDANEASTDVDPKEAAREICDLVARYLDLQPHERANLSIMLYHCDASGLPLATVNALSSLQNDEEVHCNVLVRHRDRTRLHRVYSELLEKSEIDADATVVSETSHNFMSKLRIGVSLDGVAPAASGSDRNVDIAFLHDVVSRQAQEAWFPAHHVGVEIPLAEHVPARWSYRRVTAEDELKATNFLVCPRQPSMIWPYLDAVAGVVRQQSPQQGEHYIPVRQISFENRDLKAAFDDVHNIAEWVATYDDLMDKRQLAAQGVKVIRYRRQRTHGRNMVVSSTSELRILHVLVQQRLRELSLGLPEDRLVSLARRMVEDAASISGDIVLRAAKRGVSAGELIGLVLSRALVSEELGEGATAAWFFLDDYSTWLGQREEGLADILTLSVLETDGELKLRAIVTEAKYVEESGAGEASRKSRQQLHQTMRRMDDALFGDPGRLDRDLWLARIADLLLDGVAAVKQSSALERVRDGIRAGNVGIDLRGYSHVFISGPTGDATTLGDQATIADVNNGLQETFTREGVRRAVLAYESFEPLVNVRRQLGENTPWTTLSFKNPAPRVSWTMLGSRTKQTAQVEHATSAVEMVPSLLDEPSAVEVSSESAPQAAPAIQTTGSSPQQEPIVTHSESANPAQMQINETPFSALLKSRARASIATSTEDEAWLADTAQKLRTALLGYQLQAQVLRSRLTPNAALVTLRGTDRLRVEDIEGRQSALLTTHGLRLISVTPMPGEIVVGIERPKRQIVSLWDVWARRALNRNEGGLNTSFVIGLREIDGEILYLNLGGPFEGGSQHEPHTLVAGATGSGKSVLIQSLILDIAATNSSEQAHVYLVDPKSGVDYAALERLPHVQGGVIVEREAAIGVMEQLVAEMERRYRLFRDHGARDIKSYNRKSQLKDRVPMIFLIHDEFAEWMLDDAYKVAVTANVSRLGVKARAAGIHLIFAAQRPDANVMPMQLRDNLGNRLILKVASVGTSEIALGQKGAERLLGLGHTAAKLSGEPAVVYAQAPFLSDEDIERVVDAISETK